ncbi:nucleotide exchange factor GrpE [Candidatus Adlerbacteria bacterium RIFCSPHIGHO2_12_FULL_53_18]|uniref:Protein GrpE n=1 Tax=Candidatus Adlerbacteria bacterium RIFCSPHIGHO2_12_FULL_53_18 TaxID=1797242 RepID=A0A1F4XUA5_9BACT|nr:MAG: nucleotide exchange factor GrpE [Candidatus Adlerbacteria bacterium RIFCSPHIGHO2_12_FULL_53_18]
MSGDNLESEFVPEEEAEQGPALIRKLREKLKKAVEEKQKNLDGWQRAQADFVNYKREEANLASEREVRTKAELVEALLPALDSFELALKHAQTKEMNLVHKQLLDALRRLGVEFYGKPGDTFDPRRYEALRQTDTTIAEEDNTVETVERSGYAIKLPGQSSGEKIIRPAQVTIKNYHG